jgi:hypothetical protein
MLALLIASTLGGGCGVQAGYGYSGYAPTYGYRQTYVTYGATPTYAVQPYQAPVQYQAPKVDYQAVVGEYLREEYRAKKEEEQAARLARIEALLQKPAPVQYAPAPPPVQYQPVGVPSKASPQSPQLPSSQYPPPIPEKNQPSSFGGVGPPPLTGLPPGGGDAAVTQIVRNRCAACHAAPASKGRGIVLLDPTGNLAPMSPALMLAIQEDVKTGKMPQGGPELPDNELAIISGWVGDHAPEVAAFLAQGIGR